jgi:hypothetical protein
MSIHRAQSCAVAVFVLLLAGCKTPQPALDQANNGAALTVSLQAQLAALRTTQANIARLRLERIRGEHALIAESEAASAFDERIASFSGNTAEAELASVLRELADSRAKDQKDLDDALASLDANMASLLDTVPAAESKVAATQQAMAALGEQLPLAKRAQIIAAFASDLKKAIDKNQEKGEAAAAAAPQPPVQGAPATGAK